MRAPRPRPKWELTAGFDVAASRAVLPAGMRTGLAGAGLRAADFAGAGFRAADLAGTVFCFFTGVLV